MVAQSSAEAAKAVSASDEALPAWEHVEKIGAATLYLGDASTVVHHVGAVDKVISDPPYKFSTSGGGLFRKNRTGMDRIAAADLDKGFDFSVLDAALAAGADSVAVFFHFDQVFDLSSWMQASSLERHALCVWRKLNPMPVANRHYQPELEYYWHGWRRPFGVNGEGLAHMKRVWEGKVGTSDYGHPTEKPIDLMRKIVINASNVGDIVLDPFMGTGTTAVAALGLGRRFVGIEINPDYFEAACDRVRRSLAQASLFGGIA